MAVRYFDSFDTFVTLTHGSFWNHTYNLTRISKIPRAGCVQKLSKSIEVSIAQIEVLKTKIRAALGGTSAGLSTFMLGTSYRITARFSVLTEESYLHVVAADKPGTN